MSWHAMLVSAGAEFAADSPAGSPKNFGSPGEEYAALTSQAGLADLSPRTRIQITGEDRHAFLHNLSTNEIRQLMPGTGCEAYLLDARGHVLAHLHVLCRPDRLVLETVSGQEQTLLNHLEKYHIRERIEIAPARESQELLVAGPAAASILAPLLADPLPETSLSSVETHLGGLPCLTVSVDLTGNGYLLLGATDDMQGLWRRLVAAGVRPCGQDTIEVARIEAGTPFYGSDISLKNLPQEVARDAQAIHFNKGCYLGQETVARIDALGHVNRLLCQVQFGGTVTPPPGAELAAEGAVCGQVTSSAFSPRRRAPVALAYVRRGQHLPGTIVRWNDVRGEVIGRNQKTGSNGV